MQFKFDRIKKVCLNLKRSVYRRDQVENEFLKHSIPRIEYITAIDKYDLIVPELSPKLSNPETAPGILACAMSHMKAIQYAKDNKWPSVCIFEDDVIFCEGFRDKIKYVESLENFDFDIFCLGGHFKSIEMSEEDADPTEWSNIVKVITMGGTYAYILAENTYDFILRNWNYEYGADEFFSNHVYKNFNTYAHVPFLAGCLPNKSDVTGANSNYPNVGWYFSDSRSFKMPDYNLPRIDLTDTTFIIPVRIESNDRAFNFKRVIQYLCDNLNTNIIIYESAENSPCLQMLKYINKNECTILHIYERCEADVFHRTRFLNEMLAKVTTPVTVNYDIDIMLRRESYELARNRITKNGYDLIYPFGKGIQQVKVNYGGDKMDFKGRSEDLFHPQYHSEWTSLAGFVQFFNTESYRKGYMENEAFLSYGAEDRERLDRFEKLGFKVDWCDGVQAFHLEHERGVNSNANNPFFARNEGLYYQLKGMSRDQLVEYYESQEYVKKYPR